MDLHMLNMSSIEENRYVGLQGLGLQGQRVGEGTIGFHTNFAVKTRLIRFIICRGFFHLNVEIISELYQAGKCYVYPLSSSHLHHAELPNSSCAALLESIKSCSFSQ